LGFVSSPKTKQNKAPQVARKLSSKKRVYRETFEQPQSLKVTINKNLKTLTKKRESKEVHKSKRNGKKTEKGVIGRE